MKSIALIGFMGTGKSTLGKALARRLNLPLVDLDAVIVQEQQMEISAIFARDGEERFRQIEHEVLCRYAAQPDLIFITGDLLNANVDLILSPGGGAVLREENRAVLQKHCLVISLMARPEVILQRVNGDSTVRPVLEQREPGQSKLQRIERVLAQRLPFYQEADLVLDTSDKSVEALVEQVVAWIGEQAEE